MLGHYTGIVARRRRRAPRKRMRQYGGILPSSMGQSPFLDRIARSLALKGADFALKKMRRRKRKRR